MNCEACVNITEYENNHKRESHNNLKNPDFYDPEAIEARLLGIAMMLTLPDDMINEDFITEFNKLNEDENTEV